MGSDSVVELFRLMDNRAALLQLIADGTLDKEAVAAQVDVSRPTLDRAYRELQEAGILTSTADGYSLTNFGQLFCQNFRHTTDGLGTMAEFREVLSRLPADASIDTRVLDGASLSRADGGDVTTAVSEAAGPLRDATELTAYVPPTNATVLDAVGAAPGAEIYEASTTAPYEVLVADQTVVIVVPAAPDESAAVLSNDTPAAGRWASEFFDRLVDAEQTRDV
ncbi:hypothetical protein ACFR9U_12725 [Halorientalis brevis]|uniref:HVO-A0261-like N-terminal domain-containing protein n=1 Tax=Halorientalis brevis TaxID=1126241 RepID=A0ABD6CC47_9EURY|nr:winged helix-turn-helix domain-containing protein [Halorientalis brevis]